MMKVQQNAALNLLLIWIFMERIKTLFFQTQRSALRGFKADLPDGRYMIYLYWAELSGADNLELALSVG